MKYKPIIASFLILLSFIGNICAVTASEAVSVSVLNGVILGTKSAADYSSLDLDVNGDGAINVGDIMNLLYTIKYDTPSIGEGGADPNSPVLSPRRQAAAATVVATMGPSSAQPGEVFTLKVVFSGIPSNLAGFQCLLSLPSGFSASVDKSGKALDSPSLNTTLAKTLTYFGSQVQSNGSLQMLTYSKTVECLPSSSSSVTVITIPISAPTKSGVYTLSLKNLIFTNEKGVTTKKSDVNLSFTVTDPSTTPGDVNDDGAVTLADATTLISAINGNPPSCYDVSAADLNSDEKIDAYDLKVLGGMVIGYTSTAWKDLDYAFYCAYHWTSSGTSQSSSSLYYYYPVHQGDVIKWSTTTLPGASGYYGVAFTKDNDLSDTTKPACAGTLVKYVQNGGDGIYTTNTEYVTVVDVDCDYIYIRGKSGIPPVVQYLTLSK